MLMVVMDITTIIMTAGDMAMAIVAGVPEDMVIVAGVPEDMDMDMVIQHIAQFTLFPRLAIVTTAVGPAVMMDGLPEVIVMDGPQEVMVMDGLPAVDGVTGIKFNTGAIKCLWFNHTTAISIDKNHISNFLLNIIESIMVTSCTTTSKCSNKFVKTIHKNRYLFTLSRINVHVRQGVKWNFSSISFNRWVRMVAAAVLSHTISWSWLN